MGSFDLRFTDSRLNGAILITEYTDNWGPYTFDLSQVIPSGTSIITVTAKSFFLNTRSESGIVEPDSAEVVPPQRVRIRLQWPGGGYGGTHEVQLDVMLDNGGRHRFTFRGVKVSGPQTELSEWELSQLAAHLQDYNNPHRVNWSQLLGIAPFPLIDHIGNYGDDLAAAVQEIGASYTVLVINKAITVPDNLTVPKNVVLYMLPPGRINLPAGVILNIGSFVAGRFQVFEGAGFPVFSHAAIWEVPPEWFGAEANTGLDHTAAIQKAVNVAAKSRIHIVGLGNGSYTYTRLWLSYDPIFNPDYPTDIDAQRGIMRLRGTGRVTPRAVANDYVYWTQLVSIDPVGPAINSIGTWDPQNEDEPVGNSVQLEGLTAIATNTTQVICIKDVPNNSHIHDAFVRQYGAGDGIYWENVFYVNMENVHIHGAGKTISGYGCRILNPKGNAGGFTGVTGCSAHFFRAGWQFGGDLTETSSRLHGFNCQRIEGRRCFVGFIVGAGIDNIDFNGFHVEGSDYGAFIYGRADNVHFESGDFYKCIQKAVILGGDENGPHGATTDRGYTFPTFSHVMFIAHPDCLSLVRLYTNSYGYGATFEECSFNGVYALNPLTGIELDDSNQLGVRVVNPKWNSVDIPINYPERIQYVETESNLQLSNRGTSGSIVPPLRAVVNPESPFLGLKTHQAQGFTTYASSISNIKGVGVLGPGAKDETHDGWIFAHMIKVSLEDRASGYRQVWIPTYSPDPLMDSLVAEGALPRENCRICGFDGIAFVDFAIENTLTPYIGQFLVITDSAGKQIKGYIKAAGTEEVLGSEILLAWTNNGYDPFTVDGLNITSAVKVPTTNAVCYGTALPSGDRKLYRWSLESFTQVSGTAPSLKLGASTTGLAACDLLIQADYAGVRYFTRGTVPNYGFRNPDGDTSWSATGPSMKQVTAPSPTGVTIVNSFEGTTYNWNFKEVDFNWNDLNGYTYQILAA